MKQKQEIKKTKSKSKNSTKWKIKKKSNESVTQLGSGQKSWENSAGLRFFVVDWLSALVHLTVLARNKTCFAQCLPGVRSGCTLPGVSSWHGVTTCSWVENKTCFAQYLQGVYSIFLKKKTSFQTKDGPVQRAETMHAGFGKFKNITVLWNDDTTLHKWHYRTMKWWRLLWPPTPPNLLCAK